MILSEHQSFAYFKGSMPGAITPNRIEDSCNRSGIQRGHNSNILKPDTKDPKFLEVNPSFFAFLCTQSVELGWFDTCDEIIAGQTTHVSNARWQIAKTTAAHQLKK